MKKIIYALIAIILFIPLLSACGGDSNTSDTSQTSKQGSTTNVDVGQNSAVPDKPVEIGMFINFSWFPKKAWTGPIPEEVTKKTGVKLKFTIASEDSQLMLLIASGAIPDMIFTDYNSLKKLSDPILCYSWNELIEHYAPDFVIEKKRSKLYTMSDGRFYTLLNNFGTKDEWNSEEYAMPTGAGLCFRKDLMEKLGNPQINTFADLDRVLDMAKKQFPGITPLVMNTNWKGNYIALQYGLSVNRGFVEDSNGKIVYYIKQQGRLDYYKTMNKFYRKGYIIPENYVYKNEEDSYQMAIMGKCFAYMKMNTSANELNIESAQAGTDYKFIQLVNPISDKAAYYNTGIGWAGVFIARNNKHPKESINMMKFLSSQEGQRLSYWGEEGKYWTMNPKGFPEFKVNTGDEAFLEKEGMKWCGIFANNAITEGLFNYAPDRKQTNAAAAEIKKRTIYRPELGLLIPDAKSSESTIRRRLDDMIKNEEIKIYLANSEDECVKAYNNMLKTAEQLGVSKLENWANTKYTEVQALFK